MITNIWLKSQPKKKLAYPNCFFRFVWIAGTDEIQQVEIENFEDGKVEAIYGLKIVSRVEYRP